ncbi:hypothetical protein [Desulfocurvibacter africanus]|uniref:hypothetical protein n=1 Tax=Desulfocurvibacter africanus TaxID=873 RepID=UPI0004184BFB|nr:hypothetical protein [Desulfocurvibacter africanus]
MAIDVDRAIDDLVNLAPNASMVRHEPGLVVLKVGAATLKSALHADMTNLAQSIPGIHDTKLKLLSRTLHITYDESVLPYGLWEDLGKLKGQPDGQQRLRERLREILKRDKA